MGILIGRRNFCETITKIFFALVNEGEGMVSLFKSMRFLNSMRAIG